MSNKVLIDNMSNLLILSMIKISCMYFHHVWSWFEATIFKWTFR